MSERPFALEGEPRKIAVLRANAIGDFVFALPALAALRQRFPHTEIVLLGLPWHVDFLRGRDSPVDRVVPLPKIRGIGAPEDFDTNELELQECIAALRDEAFDLVVQLHGGGRHSNHFVREIQPRQAIGLSTPDALPLDASVRYVYWQPEILRLLEVVSLVGAVPAVLTPALSVKQEDLAEARAACGLPRGRLVALHAGAGDPRRRWPLENFARTGRTLRDAGWEIAIVGSEQDDTLARSLTEKLAGRAANLAGRLSLGGLAGLLSECRLLIGNDSGPLHIAEAVGTPTVGVYWCGNIVNAGPITRATHRPVLSWRLECPVCGAGVHDARCTHDAPFADLAPVEEVLEQAFDLLGVPAPSP